jgi:hypothetical protein
MSYDLSIATRTRPKPDSVEEFAKVAGAKIRAVGAFKPGSNVLVVFAAGDGGDGSDGRTIDVDGPSAVDIDDLPDDLAGVVPRARWLVDVHVPAGSDAETHALALDMAVHLAREGDGAVFDPQDDRIAWPSGVTPRARGSAGERIRAIDLEWFVPTSSLPGDAARRWVERAKTDFPACAPVRFGPYEPFQGKLDRDGVDGFQAIWAEQAADAIGGSFFWTARDGGLSGSVFFADHRIDSRPARVGSVTHLSASIDARPIHRDPARREELVAFFSAVAADFGAAYGAACVTRDAILRRGRTSFDQRSEMGPLPRARWWVGLPALPTWLAWFGEPYRELVADAVSDWIVRAEPSGVLTQFGPEPMDVDQLQGVFPALPPELVARPRDGSVVDPAIRITFVHGPPSQPAEVIPWME